MSAPWLVGQLDGPQGALAAALDELRDLIARKPATRKAGDSARTPAASGIDLIADRFSLSPFERDLLLLCAGVELDAGFAEAVRVAGGPPSFGFALATLPGAHWSAITPTGPLRYWRLIDFATGQPVTTASIRIDERILHFVAGVSHLDERLQGLVRAAPSPDQLTEAHARLAKRIAALWASADARQEPWPAVQLIGDPDAGGLAVAASACAAHGLGLNLIRAADLPAGASERTGFERLWSREAALSDSALLVEISDADPPETLRAAAAFAAASRAVTLVASREPLRAEGKPLPRFDIAKPDRGEQIVLWRKALGETAARRETEIERVVSHFDLGPAAIVTASALAETQPLWDACRDQSRGRLDDLAQRIEPAAEWEDLVLPRAEADILREIVANVRQRSRIYDHWGFAGKSGRGLGVSALFAGASGTGKTLAAEIMSRELELDLFRIDLSQVVNKYIGETEKNLRRVFDAAEAAGAVLLFDEADALFGKRGEVKDSHDRYANLEVSYLLQRMECYRGLAILTTNLPQAIDPAFKRRLRFIVQFPFPDLAERAEIWRKAFPPAAPTQGLEIDQLARLNVPGGNIRNIALGAAFIAADAGSPVTMDHVRRAARAEYAKIGRTMTGAELVGWTST
ncbi:ATP-binding protein [Caulobacter endophyticus]|uniref:ATPase n=1 Tax=Caulobacter endophyticus TaxID=2172652 RepID=A0A2T9JER2_9CAUL|nr:ATP-binding protein [Caulobacter endophyticus]PVM82183.1 ATPase [Caulobacter endophyticus]